MGRRRRSRWSRGAVGCGEIVKRSPVVESEDHSFQDCSLLGKELLNSTF